MLLRGATHPLPVSPRPANGDVRLPAFLPQNQDYRIQFDALQRLFVLPKPNSPHTLVVAALDPPIRKGQTHYAHVLAHFPTDEVGLPSQTLFRNNVSTPFLTTFRE